MTSAILEILALLIVACLIGVFFTFRYWKAKLNTKEDELNSAKKSSESLSDQLSQERTKKSELQQQLTAKESEVNELKAEMASKKKVKKAEPKADKSREKELKDEIVLLNEQMGEKEREIEMLSQELAKKKISYYKQIDGKRYKAVTIKMADDSVSGKGDGRISKQDAEKIFATISDGKSYTQVEKDTMRYLRDNYNWTETADELFRTKVRSWAAKGHELD